MSYVDITTTAKVIRQVEYPDASTSDENGREKYLIIHEGKNPGKTT
jgi:hypothetical protein